MTIIELAEELEKCHLKYDKLFPDYIKKRNVYEQLEDYKKDIYYQGMPETGTEELKKKHAETNENYREYKKGLSQARLEKDRAFAMVKPIEVRIESLRTMLSALKQEIRQFGG